MWLFSTVVLLSLANLQTTRSAASSAWHLDTLNILVNERLDPIVSPNGVSSHTHMVMGGANFGAAYNYATSMAAKCSSASVQADKSNYWTPKLFWVNNASSFTPIPSSHRFYYFLHDPSPNQVVSPFPPGLRMLVGDPNSKSPNTDEFEFICHSASSTGSDQTLDNFNFPTDCINGLKLEFKFPNCWDGVNLYKSDMSHMTREISGNQCPLTHPVKLPSIMLESTYSTSSVSPKTPLKGHLAWANGDTTGYGIHADFINGWDVDVLHKALNTPACMPNSAITIGDCPVFQPYFDLSAAAACKPALGQMNEVDGAVVDGVAMARLPGCNPLWGSGSKPGCSSTPQAPNPSHWTGVDQSLTLSTPDKYAVGQAPAFDPNVNKYTSLYCVSSYGGGGTILSNDMVSYNDPQLSASACQQLCLKSGFVYSAVGNRNNNWQCQCGSALNPNAAIYPNMCTASCPGKSSESCGGSSLTLEIYYNPKPQIQTGSLGYYGCYRNPNNAASGMQSGATYHFVSNSMTNDLCTSTCKSRGNRWAMTYRQTECFCGDDVNLAGQMFVPDNQGCTSKCAGNSGQICGGTYFASVFAIKDLPLVTTPGQAVQNIATGNTSSSASKISSSAKSSAKASSTSIARSSSIAATRSSSSSSKVTTTSKSTVSSGKATSTVNTKTTSTQSKAPATSSKTTVTSTTRATTAAASRSSSSSRSVLPARGSAAAANALYVNNVVQPSVTESEQYPPSPTDTSSVKGSTCKPNARHRRRVRAVKQA